MFGKGVSTNTTSVEDLDLMKADVNRLDARMTLLDSRLGEETLIFGDIVFKSTLETQVFVKNHVPTCSWECFFDMNALMDTLRNTNSDEKSFVESEYNAQKTKYKSRDEVSISNSFVRFTPTPFTRHSSDKASEISYESIDMNLPVIKNRKAWMSKGGLEGMKRSLEKEMFNRKQSVEKTISRTLGKTKGGQLALEYLNMSYSCFTEFFNWTESFYQELQTVSRAGDKDAWDLVLKCWMAFFSELRRVRCECSGLSGGGMTIGSPERIEVVGQYIWTMGKAIKIQNEFRDRHFKEHPAVATVVNYYLFEHMMPKSISDSQHDDLKKEIKALKDKDAQFESWKSQTGRTVAALQKKNSSS